MATSSTLLFDDIFSVHTIDPSGKKFDRVSRVCAHSRNADMELTLDVNTQIYPLQVSDSFSLALASSLFPDQESRTNEAWLMRPGESGLADDYEYVMYGKVYKFDEG
ncbi:nucleic acid-binding protein, partial [Atractiella rhizophila]